MTKEIINEVDFGDFKDPTRAIKVSSIKQLHAQIKEQEDLFKQQMEKVNKGEVVYSDTELFLFKAQHEVNIEQMTKDLKSSIEKLPKAQRSEFVEKIEQQRKAGSLKQK